MSVSGSVGVATVAGNEALSPLTGDDSSGGVGDLGGDDDAVSASFDADGFIFSGCAVVEAAGGDDCVAPPKFGTNSIAFTFSVENFAEKSDCSAMFLSYFLIRYPFT